MDILKKMAHYVLDELRTDLAQKGSVSVKTTLHVALNNKDEFYSKGYGFQDGVMLAPQLYVTGHELSRLDDIVLSACLVGLGLAIVAAEDENGEVGERTIITFMVEVSSAEGDAVVLQVPARLDKKGRVDLLHDMVNLQEGEAKDQIMAIFWAGYRDGMLDRKERDEANARTGVATA